MKIFRYNTATAFEHPTIRGWLFVFACGFLIIWIIGPALCLGLWLIGLGATAVKLSSVSAILAVSTPVAARIIFQVATVFGALLATLSLYESARRKRQDIRIPGHHPIMGDFEHSPYFKTWHAKPMLPTGHAVSLDGQGSRPSDIQAALWSQFIARYDEMIATATQALLTEPHPLQRCAAVKFTPSGITLTPDGGLHLGFEFATVPEDFWMSEAEPPYPTASFTSGLELKSTEWLSAFGQSM